ncbi:Pyrophosphate--fructose 6-phosphate 1-phosphotransferase subunit beta [Panicum miliaceum]|uniref:Pyrophosphate--fructose 6-phosphate 1-phosphotransferase subunit beta n=1 Tax=Panicum miliaceum TaxID=4540 RepID=A0A3L6Q712_PANMI|nr:Pyrophosphate--fructose 6-phosphate 1-phosphotransferase subunit beta [Panicum miliaceum]
MKCKYVELNFDFVYPYKNQFKQAEDTANKLDLDGLVIGVDSNTNASLLAEYFRSFNTAKLTKLHIIDAVATWLETGELEIEPPLPSVGVARSNIVGIWKIANGEG